jgi:SAM-dependent methyltransferase
VSDATEPALKTRDDILLPYMSMAPLPLAFERTMEANIYRGLPPMQRPILDIGCGEGLFAKLVFDGKIDVGIDPDPRELSRAKEFDSYHELIQCFGDKIPKPDGSFQTIFSNSVLEHIPDLEPVLREAHRLLAPGGRFYFTVPSENFERYTVGDTVLSGLGLRNLSARFRKFFNNFWRHYHYYPLDGWKDLARRCGFEVIDGYTYNPKRTAILDDFLVPFSLVGFVLKKLTNRWTILPSVRRVLMIPFYLIAKPLLHGAERAERGGLVFVALTKTKGGA